MIIGLSFVVDAAFRRDAKCVLCEQPIGDEDFVVKVMPREDREQGDSVVQGDTLSVAHLIEITQQHLRCAKLMSEAVDASFPRKSKP